MVLGVSSVLAYKSKSKKLSVYFLLLTAYTLNLFTIILESYSRVNIPLFQAHTGRFWIHLMMCSHFFLMYAVLMFHGYFSSNGTPGRKWVSYAALCSVLFAYDWIYPRRSTGFHIFGIPAVDMLFFGSIVYVLIRGFFRLAKIEQRTDSSMHALELVFFKRLQWLIIILLPFVLNDDLHFVYSPVRFSPILYAGINGIFLQLLIKYYLAHYYLSEGDIISLGTEKRKQAFSRYGITEREQEIMHLVLKGYSNARIGKELYVSLATVKTHVYNIFKKTGIKSRFELIHFVKTHSIE